MEEKFMEGMRFCQEAHRRGIHRRNGYFAGNHQHMSEESTGGKGFRRALPSHVRGINRIKTGKSKG
jgi:hypothetical protein